MKNPTNWNYGTEWLDKEINKAIDKELERKIGNMVSVTIEKAEDKLARQIEYMFSETIVLYGKYVKYIAAGEYEMGKDEQLWDEYMAARKKFLEFIGV